MAPRQPHAKGRAYIRAQHRAGCVACGWASQAKTHHCIAWRLNARTDYNSSQFLPPPPPPPTTLPSSLLPPPRPSSSSALPLIPPRREIPPMSPYAVSSVSFSCLFLRLLLPARRHRPLTPSSSFPPAFPAHAILAGLIRPLSANSAQRLRAWRHDAQDVVVSALRSLVEERA